jgi:hypothetical protein
MADPPVWADEDKEKADESDCICQSEAHVIAASALEQCVSERRITSTSRERSQ